MIFFFIRFSRQYCINQSPMSIYDDLRRLASNIKTAKRINIAAAVSTSDAVEKQPDINETVLSSSNVGTVDIKPTITIEAIVTNIQLPLVPLKDGNGYVYDTGTIAAKCPSGHIHKYFINDVMLTPPQCTTCSKGIKFTNLVRETVENALRAPFVINTTHYTTSSIIEYINPIVKVVLACSRGPGPVIPSITQPDGSIIIHFRPTTSQKKVSSTLCSALLGHSSLTDEQCHRLLNIEPKSSKKKHQLADLPFTSELAALGSYQLTNIVNDKTMYLENC